MRALSLATHLEQRDRLVEALHVGLAGRFELEPLASAQVGAGAAGD